MKDNNYHLISIYLSYSYIAVETENDLINPANLRAIGFTEVLEGGIRKFKRGKDVIWFTGPRTIEAELSDGMTFSILAREIILKLA